MKKKILGGAIATIAIFFFFGALTLKTNAAGSVSLSADQNTLTLSGSTSGSENLGDVDCFLPSGARAFINTTNPADPNGYTISNSSGVSVLSSGSIPGWTETDPGNSGSGCGGKNPLAIPPTYSFGGNIDVSSLADGTYTMAVLVGNEATGKIDQITASFTLSRAATGNYSFTPLDITGLGLVYGASTQMLTLTGSMDVGTETFNTVGGGCPGTPNGTYSVTAPMDPQSVAWTIKNSSGATVLSGQSPFNEWSGNTPVSYSFPCATRMDNSVFTMVPAASLDVSSLSPGTYTFNTVVTEGNCIASSPDTSCPASVIASIPKSTWSGKFTVPVPTSAPTGTVTVASENSITGSGVNSSWDVLDGASDLCGNQSCTEQSKTFNNVPLGITATVQATAGSAGSSFALRGVREELPIVKNGNNGLDGFLALSKNLFVGVANALTYCGYMDSNSGQCPLPYTGPSVSSLTPDASHKTANFIILWDPEASMSVVPASVSLSSASPSQQISVKNVSTAQGSKLGWATSVNYTNGSNWLSVTPSTDLNGLSDGASEPITLSADTTGLAVGTYQATVDIFGYSVNISPTTKANNYKVSVSITLTVANPTGSTITGVGVTCKPSTVNEDGTSACAAIVSGTGSYSSGVVWSVNLGTINQGGNYTAPGTTGTATVTATSKQDPTKSGTTTISILSSSCESAGCQAVCSPSLTASPKTVVVPESSGLQYSCSHVTSCQLTQGNTVLQTVNGGSSETVSSTYPVTPSVTTIYTLTCENSGYSGDSVNSSAQVTVSGSSRCEQNPNGAGCPGQ